MMMNSGARKKREPAATTAHEYDIFEEEPD